MILVKEGDCRHARIDDVAMEVATLSPGGLGTTMPSSAMARRHHITLFVLGKIRKRATGFAANELEVVSMQMIPFYNIFLFIYIIISNKEMSLFL